MAFWSLYILQFLTDLVIYYMIQIHQPILTAESLKMLLVMNTVQFHPLSRYKVNHTFYSGGIKENHVLVLFFWGKKLYLE